MVGLVAANAIGMFGNGCPNVVSPGPLTLIVPGFMGVPVSTLPVIAAFLFVAWEMPLMLNRPSRSAFPIRTWVLVAVAGILSAICFRTGWVDGERYEGLAFTSACATLSGCMFIAIVIAGWIAAGRRTLLPRILGEALVFVWLFTYAFPYLGETP